MKEGKERTGKRKMTNSVFGRYHALLHHHQPVAAAAFSPVASQSLSCHMSPQEFCDPN